MINNFKQISDMLTYDSEDDFYFLEIIQRRKENPTLKNGHKTIKTYCITSKEHFTDIMSEIISICDFYNARAYINLNRRSYEKTSYEVLKKITNVLINKNYQNTRKLFESACREVSSEKNKSWIIDIDEKDFEIAPSLKWHLTDIKPISNKVKTEIPTKNGYHIITTPFNIMEFRKLYPDINVHKEGLTLLYIS